MSTKCYHGHRVMIGQISLHVSRVMTNQGNLKGDLLLVTRHILGT